MVCTLQLRMDLSWNIADCEGFSFNVLTAPYQRLRAAAFHMSSRAVLRCTALASRTELGGAPQFPDWRANNLLLKQFDAGDR
eukprot:8971106-Alexandrium_andersonii.AAC.1